MGLGPTRRILITGGSGFIGVNLASALANAQVDFCNLDLQPPVNGLHRSSWIKGDLMDLDGLSQAIAAFQPDAVIHLAARAECDEQTTVENGYRVNTEGTENLLEAVRRCPVVRRLIVASSQYVCGPERLPTHDEDYFPHTVYGQSKVITEQLVRQADLPNTCWTLLRPTNVWGPWHPRYPQQAWKVLRRGWYLHPTAQPVRRCYVYIGNVVHDILTLLQLPTDTVAGRTVYLTDPADDILHWVNAFSQQLRGKKVFVAPFWFVRFLAYVGDTITAATGREFYLTSNRLRSMTTDYLVPEQPSREILGPSRYSLAEGVAETIAWMRKQETNPSDPKTRNKATDGHLQRKRSNGQAFK